MVLFLFNLKFLFFFFLTLFYFILAILHGLWGPLPDQGLNLGPWRESAKCSPLDCQQTPARSFPYQLRPCGSPGDQFSRLPLIWKCLYFTFDFIYFIEGYSWLTVLCYFCCIAMVQLYTNKIHILFQIFFHCGLSQNNEYSSLCHTVSPLFLRDIFA